MLYNSQEDFYKFEYSIYNSHNQPLFVEVIQKNKIELIT